MGFNAKIHKILQCFTVSLRSMNFYFLRFYSFLFVTMKKLFCRC